jgi:hypothetical protein
MEWVMNNGPEGQCVQRNWLLFNKVDPSPLNASCSGRFLGSSPSSRMSSMRSIRGHATAASITTSSGRRTKMRSLMKRFI